jgi:nucleotide-binding universal stress UspA family protein
MGRSALTTGPLMGCNGSMTEYRNSHGPIVVGVDGSQSALDAAAWAAREADAHETELVIVHAFLWPLLGVVDETDRHSLGSRVHARSVLSDAADVARRSAPDVLVREQLDEGWPVAVLRSASRDAYLLVVGGYLTGRMHAAVAGSTVIDLSGSLDVPIVSVGSVDPGSLPEAPTDLPITVGVDGSAVSRRATAFAALEARRHRAPLQIIHAASSAGSEHYATTTTFAEEIRRTYPDLDVDYRAVEGHPGDALASASCEARLLVVGSRGLGGLKGLLLGSVSQRLMRDAECPLAVVPRSWRPRANAADRSHELAARI